MRERSERAERTGEGRYSERVAATAATAQTGGLSENRGAILAVDIKRAT